MNLPNTTKLSRLVWRSCPRSVRLSFSFVLLEAACIAVVQSPLRENVAAVAGQTTSASGAAASPLVALLVVGVEMAATTLIPIAIIACIIHACILHAPDLSPLSLKRTGNRARIGR